MQEVGGEFTVLGLEFSLCQRLFHSYLWIIVVVVFVSTPKFHSSIRLYIYIFFIHTLDSCLRHDIFCDLEF